MGSLCQVFDKYAVAPYASTLNYTALRSDAPGLAANVILVIAVQGPDVLTVRAFEERSF